MGRKKQMIKKDITPKVIKEYLDEVMVGQDESKRRVAVEIYRHALRMDNEFELDDMGKSISKNNVLMTGLTGTGKTFMWQKIAEFLDIPIYIQDTTKMTASGYVGEDIENCLKGLLENADYDFDKAERGIIVLDELDKSSRKSEHPSVTRDVSGESVQQGLLNKVNYTQELAYDILPLLLGIIIFVGYRKNVIPNMKNRRKQKHEENKEQEEQKEQKEQ